jgi:CRISPR/Cas system Type II protein with McrA/HNH and RuvC-like nuclease domain
MVYIILIIRKIYIVMKKIELLFKRFILSEDKKFKSIKKEIQYYEKSQVKTRSREPIPEDVRFEVWRRDEGKCVECGSKNNLEFDHIIPFSLGGSNTARNLQLLCEECNRKKSNKI